MVEVFVPKGKELKGSMPGLTVTEMGSQGRNDGNDVIIGDVEAIPLLEDRRTWRGSNLDPA